MRTSIFDIPNYGKNVKVEEMESGLKMHYVLSCPKTFPNITFQSKGKAYYKKTMLIPYGDNMSKRINYAYNKLKISVTLDLARYKFEFFADKYNKLAIKQSLIHPYK